MASEDSSDVAKWDPRTAERLVDLVRPIGKRWFRWEVRGLERVPPAVGALVVSNHSGGSTSTDVVMFAADFYEHFGYSRPLYSVGHDGLFMGPLADPMTRLAVIRANRDNAVETLCTGEVVSTFPGGFMTSTGRRAAPTSSTSKAARATSKPRSKRACRSFRQRPSALRKASYF